ncbi:DNA-3-methyladenine glycosylase [Panacibacter ginsenosidivorans]|uniref:DNA-3-methyladenine glycosylase n=1 Tax=Panacibacter ginsenosidivorans TaxID=1813871 RepID=UPI001CEFA9A8|nr:DNA-3-methyladenine glycosylase [Panacibacter ginsenosidivorans]
MKRFEPNKIDKHILLNASAKLDVSFYNRSNVLQVAEELLGKILVTNFDNKITAARIVETEAYNGIVDKASHAYNNRRTARTEIMYGNAGTAYVYLCYGIHHLFNVVTNAKNIPHAILIRAAEPVYGLETMLNRTRKLIVDNTLTKGPGNVSKALGIDTAHTGLSLLGKKIFIVDDNYSAHKNAVSTSVRIGVDYAAEDALLPYRFYIKGNVFVSGKIK